MVFHSYKLVFAFKIKQSDTAQLIQTTCNAYHFRNSDKYGVALYFNSYLYGQSKKNHFVSFIGNRFSILFYNTAALYYHVYSIKDFITKLQTKRFLLKSLKKTELRKFFLLRHISFVLLK